MTAKSKFVEGDNRIVEMASVMQKNRDNRFRNTLNNNYRTLTKYGTPKPHIQL